jgi:hypothetical protein
MADQSSRSGKFQPVGMRMRNFGRSLIRTYVASANLTPPADLPPSWQTNAEQPLVWRKAEQQAPASPPEEAAASEEEAPRQSGGIDPMLLRLLEMHQSREAQEAQRKAELAAEAQARAESTLSQAGGPESPRPRRRGAIIEVTPTIQPQHDDEAGDFEAELNDWPEDDAGSAPSETPSAEESHDAPASDEPSAPENRSAAAPPQASVQRRPRKQAKASAPPVQRQPDSAPSADRETVRRSPTQPSPARTTASEINTPEWSGMSGNESPSSDDEPSNPFDVSSTPVIPAAPDDVRRISLMPSEEPADTEPSEPPPEPTIRRAPAQSEPPETPKSRLSSRRLPSFLRRKEDPPEPETESPRVFDAPEPSDFAGAEPVPNVAQTFGPEPVQRTPERPSEPNALPSQPAPRLRISRTRPASAPAQRTADTGMETAAPRSEPPLSRASTPLSSEPRVTDSSPDSGANAIQRKPARRVSRPSEPSPASESQPAEESAPPSYEPRVTDSSPDSGATAFQRTPARQEAPRRISRPVGSPSTPESQPVIQRSQVEPTSDVFPEVTQPAALESAPTSESRPRLRISRSRSETAPAQRRADRGIETDSPQAESPISETPRSHEPRVTDSHPDSTPPTVQRTPARRVSRRSSPASETPPTIQRSDVEPTGDGFPEVNQPPAAFESAPPESRPRLRVSRSRRISASTPSESQPAIQRSDIEPPADVSPEAPSPSRSESAQRPVISDRAQRTIASETHHAPAVEPTSRPQRLRRKSTVAAPPEHTSVEPAAETPQQADVPGTPAPMVTSSRRGLISRLTSKPMGVIRRTVTGEPSEPEWTAGDSQAEPLQPAPQPDFAEHVIEQPAITSASDTPNIITGSGRVQRSVASFEPPADDVEDSPQFSEPPDSRPDVFEALVAAGMVNPFTPRAASEPRISDAPTATSRSRIARKATRSVTEISHPTPTARRGMTPPASGGQPTRDVEATTPEPDSPEAGLLELLHLPRSTPIVGLKRATTATETAASASSQPAPVQPVTPPLEHARTPDIRRAVTFDEVENNTSGDTDAGSGGDMSTADVEKLAQEVYQVLRNRLRIERERRHRP